MNVEKTKKQQYKFTIGEYVFYSIGETEEEAKQTLKKSLTNVINLL